jgi:thiamine phosphate synthase YjbQ (UPF0047 family)
MVHTQHISLSTRGGCDMHDLTPRVEQIVHECRLRAGTVTVFSPSSTSALTTIEFETGALDDLRAALERIAPAGVEYRHNLA